MDDDVEAIEQGAGELHPVRGKLLRRAAALHSRVAARAAGAQVHRPDEHESRWEDGLAGDPRDRDHAVFERLAQRFEHRAVELRQLVE